MILDNIVIVLEIYFDDGLASLFAIGLWFTGLVEDFLEGGCHEILEELVGFG